MGYKCQPSGHDVASSTYAQADGEESSRAGTNEDEKIYSISFTVHGAYARWLDINTVAPLTYVVVVGFIQIGRKLSGRATVNAPG